MEKERLVVCDTNVLIDVIDRDNQDVIEKLIGIGSSQLCISSISYSEIVVGASSKIHLLKLIKKLDNFPVLPLNPTIDSIHRELLLKYTLSHGLDIPDALIAATALFYDFELYTLNVKDFRFIKGLRLI